MELTVGNVADKNDSALLVGHLSEQDVLRLALDHQRVLRVAAICEELYHASLGVVADDLHNVWHYGRVANCGACVPRSFLYQSCCCGIKSVCLGRLAFV